MPNRWNLPDPGLGLGLRAPHVADLLAREPEVGFLELLTENHLDVGSRRTAATDAVAARFPVVLHGVSMNLGSVDPLDGAYLAKVRDLARRTGALWVSDHLCFTGVAGLNTHDLLPLPLTEACLRHVAGRVRAAQDVLGAPLLLENPSTYVAYRASTMSEPEFLGRLAEDADCALLVDVNNVYVSAKNHAFDPEAYVDALPADRVVQVHLAGHHDAGTHLIDTHDAPVIDDVWRLYARLVARTGPVATMIERDDRIPPLDALLAELRRAAPTLDAARGAAEPSRA
ncbi:MAG TPA: DUF692 domain-containing protein [Planctomycetota bacterium]|nr:DUF692 domain-containing protein [Planctomycetota bacterium]